MALLNKIFSRSSTSPKSRSNPVTDNCGTNNLPPLLFHPVHGENIRLSNDGSLAKRSESFCKGICFSNRPVKINERVFLRFADISQCWSGAVRFGFTANDPTSFRNGLPKYACPDLTNKDKNWAKALAERYAQKDSVLFYYLKEDGDVVYGIDGEEKGVFFSGVTTTQPVWALIDIYGNTCAIELVDMRRSYGSGRGSRGRTSSGHVNQAVQLMDNLTLSGSEVHRENREPLPQVYCDVTLTPLPFHKTRGCNIRLSNDRSIAERNDNMYCQGYVFTERPIRVTEKLVVQILQTDEIYAGSLAFGVTSCNPATLSFNDLPEDPHLLLDRSEYWVVIKDVASSPQAGDELAFKITENGEVIMTKNRQPPITLMHVDASQNLWLFFDLYGSTLKMKTLGTTTGEDMNVNARNAEQQQRLMRQRSPLQSIPQSQDSALTMQLTVRLSPSPTNDTSLPGTSSSCSPSTSLSTNNGGGASKMNSECTVCYEKPINSVLYNCGHMCMCFECAHKQLRGNGGSGVCPICRAIIRDVIRAYWS